MTIQQLRMLGYLAECGSISRTAEICFLSQSALTRQIRSMEDELGYALFTRSFSGVQLTPAGEAFCNATRALIADYDKAVYLGREACKSERRLILRTGVYSNSMGLVVPMLKECETRLPPIHFDFITSRMLDSYANLQANRLDLCFPAEKTEDEGFCFDSLLISRNCMRIPVGNPLYGRHQLTLSDLHGQTVLMLPEGMAQNSDHLRATITMLHPEIRVLDYNSPIEAEAEALTRGFVMMSLGFFEPKKGFSFAVLSDFPGVVLGVQYRKEDAQAILPVVEAMRAYLARQMMEPFLSLYQEDVP